MTLTEKLEMSRIINSSNLKDEQIDRFNELLNLALDEVKSEAMRPYLWIDADDEVPSDNRYILIHFSNFSVPMIGRYDGNEEEGFAFYIGDEFDSTYIQEDLFVDYWMEIPGLEVKKC